MSLANYFPIIHCEFEYACPLNWNELRPTDNAMVRYCDQYFKKVTLCLDEVQIDSALEKGQCIAYPFNAPELMEAISAFEKVEGPNPLENIPMPMGLPKNRHSK